MNKLIVLIDKLYIWSHKYCEQIIHYLLATLVMLISVYCFNVNLRIPASAILQIEIILWFIKLVFTNKSDILNLIGGVLGIVTSIILVLL